MKEVNFRRSDLLSGTKYSTCILQQIKHPIFTTTDSAPLPPGGSYEIKDLIQSVYNYINYYYYY